MKRLHFKVSVDLPEGCTVTEVKDYIEESVATWRGCKDPDSAIFDLNSDTVRVDRIYKQKKTPSYKPDVVGHIED